MSANGLYIFAACLLRKLLFKFLLAPMKTLTISGDFTEDHIRISFPAYESFVVFVT